MIGATGWCDLAGLPRASFDALFAPPAERSSPAPSLRRARSRRSTAATSSPGGGASPAGASTPPTSSPTPSRASSTDTRACGCRCSTPTRSRSRTPGRRRPARHRQPPLHAPTACSSPASGRSCRSSARRASTPRSSASRRRPCSRSPSPSVAIGAARGALDTAVELAQDRVPLLAVVTARDRSAVPPRPRPCRRRARRRPLAGRGVAGRLWERADGGCRGDARGSGPRSCRRGVGDRGGPRRQPSSHTGPEAAAPSTTTARCSGGFATFTPSTQHFLVRPDTFVMAGGDPRRAGTVGSGALRSLPADRVDGLPLLLLAGQARRAGLRIPHRRRVVVTESQRPHSAAAPFSVLPRFTSPRREPQRAGIMWADGSATAHSHAAMTTVYGDDMDVLYLAASGPSDPTRASIRGTWP